MAVAALKVPTTLDEFLEWEERQAERFELVGGVVRLMAGGTGDHNQITLNIAAALRARLRGSGCFVHAADIKVKAAPGEASAYPDVLVRCGEPLRAGTVATDPVLIFEVLSDGTAEYDLTQKRRAYKTIATLRAFFYVSQKEARIEVIRRGPDGGWDEEVQPTEGVGGNLPVPELRLSLPMAEVYEDTAVAAAAAARATSVPS